MMKRYVSLFVFISLFQAYTYAQQFNWAADIKGAGIFGFTTAIDGNGNVILAGRQEGYTTVITAGGVYPSNIPYPGPGVIMKFDSAGNYLWRITLDYVSGTPYNSIDKVVADSAGNITIAGELAGTFNFNPNGIAFNLQGGSGNGSSFGYSAKYTPDGILIYAKIHELLSGFSVDLSADKNGNVFYMGYRYYQMSLTTGTYIMRLDSAGNAVWSQPMDAYTPSSTGLVYEINGLAADGMNGVSCMGNFTGNINFGNAIALTSANGIWSTYLAHYDYNGNARWAKKLPTAASASAVADPVDGSVYALIGYRGAVVIEGVTYSSNGANNYDMLLVKYDIAGNYLWAKEIGNNLGVIYVLGSAVSKTGDLYISGYYKRTCDFDPDSVGVHLSTAYANGQDGFLLHLNKNGEFKNVALFSGEEDERMTWVSVGNHNEVVTTGSYEENIDADPGFGMNVLYDTSSNSSNFDCFLVKYNVAYNRLSGKVYLDNNQDTLFNAGDTALGDWQLQASPSTVITTVLPDASYELNCAAGSILIRPTDTLHYHVVPPFYDLLLPTADSVINSLNFAFQVTDTLHDMRINATALTRLRPGFGFSLQVKNYNAGTTNSSGWSSVTYDTILQFDTLLNAGFVLNGNVISKSFSNLSPFGSDSFNLHFNVPTSVSINDTFLFATAVYDTLLLDSATIVFADSFLTDNFDTLCQIASGSYDPNIKEVSPARNFTPLEAQPGQWLTYTIHFQNTGTDTAFRVLLEDQLSNLLDVSTLQLIASQPSGCEFNINEAGKAYFLFSNILLPDSHTNSLGSNGFVKYRIKTKPNLTDGTNITNTAAIYFDFNQPVITNTTVTRIEEPLFVAEKRKESIRAMLFPNPVNDAFVVELDFPQPGFYTAHLTDIAGRKITQLFEKRIDSPQHLKLNFNAGSLAAGCYLINITNSQSQSVVLKMLK